MLFRCAGCLSPAAKQTVPEAAVGPGTSRWGVFLSALSRGPARFELRSVLGSPSSAGARVCTHRLGARPSRIPRLRPPRRVWLKCSARRKCWSTPETGLSKNETKNDQNEMHRQIENTR